MIQVVAHPQPLPAPEPIPKPLEIPLSIRLLIAPIESAITWTWNVVILRAKEDGLALALLFASALGIFPLWITIAAATSGTVLISLSISNARSTTGQLQSANRTLQAEKAQLEQLNHQLIDQRGELQHRYDHATREKNDLERERDLLIAEARDIVNSKVPLQIERDQLQEELQQLKQDKQDQSNQNHELQERYARIQHAKEQLEQHHRHALAELGELRAQIGQIDEYKNLNHTLDRFHQLYQQIQKDPNDRGAHRFAQQKLIPEYKAHRARLHEMLKTSIAQLPPDDINLIPLNGILRLSQEELDHLEKISQALQLLHELGQSLKPPGKP